MEGQFPPKEGERILQDLMAHLKPEKTILHQSVTLFGEAARVFDAGAIEGTALLCRATLEAACYVFLYRDWSKGMWWRFNPPRTHDGRIRPVRLEEMKRAIARRGVLSDEQMAALGRIQEDGNLIAHVAAKQEVAMVSAAQEGDISKARLWLTRDEALRDLKDAANILQTLLELPS
ncbi:MAG TPA: hypothetical protein VF992_04730 [Thermoplasmata archaeon]